MTANHNIILKPNNPHLESRNIRKRLFSLDIHKFGKGNARQILKIILFSF
jgi:hypothetical protein